MTPKIQNELITFFLEKKGKKMSNNHYGISLFFIAERILAGVILKSIMTHLVNKIYSESQCGFKSGRGTANIACSKWLQMFEKNK